MLHPSLQTPESIKARMNGEHLSPLMRAKGKSQKGERVNFCPFGCETKHLDEHGYCRHLVGFTDDGKLYEPMVRERGKRRVRCEMVVDPNGDLGEDGEQLMIPKLPRVLETDTLVRITTSSRVYRDVDGKGAALAAKQAEAEKQKRIDERKALLQELRDDPEFKEQLLELATR